MGLLVYGGHFADRGEEYDGAIAAGHGTNHHFEFAARFQPLQMGEQSLVQQIKTHIRLFRVLLADCGNNANTRTKLPAFFETRRKDDDKFPPRRKNNVLPGCFRDDS